MKMQKLLKMNEEEIKQRYADLKLSEREEYDNALSS